MRVINTITVKIIHPTNNSDVDVELPVDIILNEVFPELIEANFLSVCENYSAVLKPRDNCSNYIMLDNQKSVYENGIQENDTIQILIPTAAGGDIDYVIDLWQTIYPFLDQVGTVLGITGSAIGFGLWIKNKFSHKYTPSSFIEKIMSKELWNVHELSLKLNIPDDDAKKLLKGFGYKWDKRLSLYVKTDKTVEILEAINKEID